MSEGFGEFVKWVVIGVVIISVYNLITGKNSNANTVQGRNPTNTHRVTVIIGEQAATTFRHW